MFFKAGKVKILAEWHEKHLGVDFGGKVYTDFKFQDEREKGWLAFSFFEAETKYFEPSAKEFMINPRAENLFELLKTPREEGVRVFDETGNTNTANSAGFSTRKATESSSVSQFNQLRIRRNFSSFVIRNL